ncbi:glycosyltransferase family 4 protein [Niallia sp. FSL M8-0099]|uniref:glycosyltransferase family 4 protein n=1 Tax=Niallia sp. FSL M8-0099 TaxID=2954519 RepID=UPI0030FC943E
MKICIVTHKLIKGDGQGRVNYEIVKTALEYGLSVIIVSTEIDESLLKNNNITWHKVRASILPTNLLKYQHFALLSTYMIKKINPDFLILNGFITWVKSDMNIVHFVHSSWVDSIYHPFREKKTIKTFYQFLYSFINSKLEKISLRSTKKIVAVSNKVKQELLKIGMPEAKIVVINNGVDIDEFTPNREGKPLFLHNNYCKRTMLFAGDIKSSRKNLDTVLKAMLMVPDIYLLVAGSKEGSVYPEIAEKMGLKERVIFLGYRNDIATLMSQVDLFVFPTRYDPFSLVVLEAMATGTAVITTKEAGVSTLLESKEYPAGIVLEDPNDENELADAINKFIFNERLLNEFGVNGRLIAEENSWSKVSKKYVKEMFILNENRVRV